ncbi:WD40 repeat-like protein [Auriculariales sp. MPI-PUGE-AT-0066]|nr:WD40 repeat-like protein [Auriculariales sp. MPI-PUGE-AT-0066]
MSDSKEIELRTPPYDTISSVSFSPTNANHLLVGAWDSCATLYDVQANELRAKFDHKAAVLSCTFGAPGKGYSGGLDTWVRELDLERESTRVLGQHAESISRVVWVKETNTLISGSWDKTIRTWDPRAQAACTATLPQPERVYCMDAVGNTVVVGMAGRHIYIFDARNMAEPMQKRESSLKYMTRAVACMIDGKGFATSSVEGRISVDYLDPSPEVQTQKYAFKCHRQTVDNVDHVWPVNTLSFHPIHGTFASGGSDGTVSLWDHTAKKRLRQLPKFKEGVPALAFSADGKKLAVAVSYCWDEGEKPSALGKTSVIVRDIGDEAKPKAK